MKTTLEILKGVRKILNSPNRWIKERLYNPDKGYKSPDSSFCILGAIGMATHGDPHCWDIKNTVVDCTKALNIKQTSASKDLWAALVNYNNNPKLTYSGMRARLDRAIKRLEAQS